MSKFNDFINQFLVEQELPPMNEPGGGMPGGGMPGGGMPGGESQPPPPEKTFDKPYRELGQLLYRALESDFDSFPEDLKNLVYDVAPNGEDSIKSDEDGSKLFAAIDDLLNSSIEPEVKSFEER